MSHVNFYNRLNKLTIKLDEYFTASYGPEVLSSFQKSNQSGPKTETIHVYHHSPICTPYVPLFYRPLYMSPPTTIINNYPNTNLPSVSKTKSEKEEKYKKEENPQATLGGVAIVGTVALAGTYVIATDEYTNYVNSDIEKEINEFFIDIALMMSSETEIVDASRKIKCCFEDWACQFKNRTYMPRNAKYGGILSGIAIGGGLILGSSAIMTGGSIGIIVSGCIFTWNYFTKKNKSEADAYNDLFKAIVDTQSIISEKYSQLSATSQFDYNMASPTTEYMASTTSYNQQPATEYTESCTSYNQQPPTGYYSPNTSTNFPSDEYTSSNLFIPYES